MVRQRNKHNDGGCTYNLLLISIVTVLIDQTLVVSNAMFILVHEARGRIAGS